MAAASTVKQLQKLGLMMFVATLILTDVSYGRVLNGILPRNVVRTMDLRCPESELQDGVFDIMVQSEAASFMGSAEGVGIIKDEGMKLVTTLLLSRLPKGGKRTGASAPSKRHNSVNN